MTKAFYLNGIQGRSIQLEDSTDRLLVRTHHNHTIFDLDLKHKKEILRYQNCLELEAHFPEASVFLYRCKSSKEDNCSAEDVKGKVRALLKDEHKNHIRYAGRVLKIVGRDVYQIYTENLFIKFHDNVSLAKIQLLFAEFELKEKKKLGFCENGYFVSVKEDTGQDVFDISQIILQHSEVELCHPELIVKKRNVFSGKDEKRDAVFTPEIQFDTHWALEKINAFEAWKTTKGRGAKICIIDDGIELGHRAFRGRLLSGKDMLDKEAQLLPDHKFKEEMHGTACASIAASADEHVLGVAPEALIMPIRQKGLGSVLEAESFYWAANNGADIISCSWGPPDGNFLDPSDDNLIHYIPDHTRLAIDYAATKGRDGKGCVVLFAAGNGNEAVANDGYAAYEKVLAIGASNKVDQPTVYSDYGPPIFCTFPSGDYKIVLSKPEQLYGIPVADRIGIEGYSRTDYFSFFDGTSASCPGVAGVIALMISVNPELSREEIKQILKDSCKKIGEPSDYNQESNTYSKKYGYGLIQADLAVKNSIDFPNIINPTIMNRISKGYSLHIGINNVDQSYYDGQVPPLRFCINDAEAMRALAHKYGFEVLDELHDARATRQNILEKIEALARQAKSGDLVWITYAGHGTQVGDTDGDEIDGFDETWVTYDGLFLDDEIYRTLNNFEAGVRVLVFSDSCHSGTVNREIAIFAQDRSAVGGESVENVRWFDPGIAVELFANDEMGIYAGLKNKAKIDRNTIPASIKLIGACQDNQLAREVDGNGVFSKSIMKLLCGNDFEGNYNDFTKAVTRLINHPNQVPQLSDEGGLSDSFNEQSPLFIDSETAFNGNDDVKQNSNVIASNPIVQTPPMTAAKPSFGNWINYLLVYTKPNKDANRSMLSNQPKRVRIIPATTEKAVWEASYKYFLNAENRSDIEYIVPDFSTSGYAIDGEEGVRKNTRMAAGNNTGYLPTYPSPPTDYVHKFRWHLDNDHSQLSKACSLVYPEINKGDIPRNTPTQKLVRIAHIDTGVSLSNPVLPVNFNENLSRSFVWGMPSFEDKETNLPVEIQGHGDGTVAILAGGEFSFKDRGRISKGYFGGNPFAEIISLKISETVVLFSGKRFAQAIRYAVDIGCDVITMSMAGMPSPVMAEAINYAYENGVVVVSAAGNSWHKNSGFWASKLPKSLLYPARYHRVIAAAGATFDHRPYIYDEQPQNQNRGMEAKYMQMNFGPERDMSSTIAGYSPNIVWFGEEGNQYSVNGGGTSSSTPQIAAAASLFIQHYQEDLALLIKDHPDKKYLKVEAVKKALFDSAKDFELYDKYFGNGVLSAYDALLEPTKGEGSKTANKHTWFTEIKNIAPEAKATSSNSLLKQLFQTWGARSLGTDLDEKLQQMLSMELMQLIYEDENLRAKLTDQSGNQLTDLNEKGDAINTKLDQELLLLLHNSDKASDFLKSRLKPMTNVKMASSLYGKDGQFYTAKSQSRTIKAQWGDYALNCPTGNILELNCVEGSEDEIEFVDIEIEVQPSDTRSLSDTAMYLSKINAQEEVAVWIETTEANGEVTGHWLFPNDAKQSNSRSLDPHAWMYGNNAMTIAIPSNGQTRGLGGIGKIAMKIVKLGGKLFGKHSFMVYDLSRPIGDKKESRKNWIDYKEMTPESKVVVDKVLMDPAAKLLVLMPGLFSKVERGFDDFLTNPSNVQFIKDTYKSNFVFGLNMPTVLSGINKNAKKLKGVFPTILKQKNCDVIARSRGGLVARCLFEKELFDNKTGKYLLDAPLVLDKLIMTGTPNQGTPLAEYDNWKTMINVATNLAIATFSSSTPVILTVSTIIKQIGERGEDLPGIADMNEQAELLKHLNTLQNINRSNYFAVSSNFEPDWNKPIWKALDETSDRFIFKDIKSDWVSPVKSTYGEMNPTDGQTFSIPVEHQFTVPSFENVHHFNYLSNEMVLETLRSWLSASNTRGGNTLKNQTVKSDIIESV